MNGVGEIGSTRHRTLSLHECGFAMIWGKTRTSGAEAARLVEQLRWMAAAKVEENWPAIGRVASALAASAPLGQAEIDAPVAEDGGTTAA